MTTTTLAPVETKTSDAEILDLLRNAAEPISASKVRAGWRGRKKPDLDALDAALESLVARGLAVRFAPYRTQKNAPRFWHRTHQEYARQVILAALHEKTRSANDLDKTLQKPLADLSKSQRREAVSLLAAEGTLFELPRLPGSRTVRYATQVPDPADYLRTAINRFLKLEEKVQQQLADMGITREQVRQATRRLLGCEPDSTPVAQLSQPETQRNGTTDEPGAILSGIRELARDPRLGGFVSLSDLRRLLASAIPDRERFDCLVLALAKNHQVDLYPHDYPGSLLEEEQQRLVADGRGNFFNGVSLRGS